MRQFLFQILVEVKLDAGRAFGNPGKCDSSTPELIGVSRGGMGPAYFLAGAIPAVSMFTSRRAAPG